jgi:hypothetical protein
MKRTVSMLALMVGACSSPPKPCRQRAFGNHHHPNWHRLL